jgi:hypothetical protein
VLSPDWLNDFLSEMLTVELGGVKLYQKALNELQHHLNWNEQILTKIAMEAAMPWLSDEEDETEASSSNRTQAESYK